MLVEDIDEGTAVRGVDVFGGQAGVGAGGVGVEVGLAPGEGEGGFRRIGEGRRQGGEDAAVPV